LICEAALESGKLLGVVVIDKEDAIVERIKESLKKGESFEYCKSGSNCQLLLAKFN